MLVTAGLGAALSACGRLHFDELSSADASSAVDVATTDAITDATAACAETTPFGPPVLISELSQEVSSDATFRLRADELAGVFWSSRSGDIDIYLATRPTITSPFQATPLTVVNSTSAEFDPAISADGTVIVFASNRPGSTGLDLYEAVATSGTFGPPVRLDALASTDGDQQPNFWGDELFFSSSRTGSSALYHAQRTGPAQYTAPVLLAEISGASENDPTLSSDGLTLYWGSTRTGSGDIYTARRASTADPFGPATLVANVNTDATDGPSWLSPDGCRLYLSSATAGSPDIYVATRP